MPKFKVGDAVRLVSLGGTVKGNHTIREVVVAPTLSPQLYKLNGIRGQFRESRLQLATAVCPVCGKGITFQEKVEPHSNSDELCYGSYMPICSYS